MIICLCTGVTSDQFTQALREAGGDWRVASYETGAGTCCGGCRPYLAEIAHSLAPTAPPLPLPTINPEEPLTS